MNPEMQTIEIHEFSTGIRPEQTLDGEWVSLGFTGKYMNSTLTEIPPIVERSISNREFAVTEGASSEQPAIIERVLTTEVETWSVVAIVTRGRDEIGRSLSVYRYFLCDNANSLWKILAWLESKGMPTFDPFDCKYIGQPNLYTESFYSTLKLSPEDENLVNTTPAPILLLPQKYAFKTVNIFAIRKAHVNSEPISWAFNVEALEKPRRFQVIQAASQRAYEILNKAIKNVVQLSPIDADEEGLKSAIRGLINSSQVKTEALQTITKALKNQEFNQQFWHILFDGQGARTAISEKIYSPQMIRLMTLRAMVIPETLPEFLTWLNVHGAKKPNENQTISLTFQTGIRKLFPPDRLTKGLKII